MSEKLLNESTIKRFMKLANLSPLSNNFLQEKNVPIGKNQPLKGGSSGKPESEETKMDRKLDDTNPKHRAYIASVKAGHADMPTGRRKKAWDAYFSVESNRKKWEKNFKNESVEPLEEEEEIKRKVFTNTARKTALDKAKEASGEHGESTAYGKPSHVAKTKVVGIQDPEQQMTVPVVDPMQTRDLPDASENLQRESVFNSDYILQETLKRVILNLKGSK